MPRERVIRVSFDYLRRMLLGQIQGSPGTRCTSDAPNDLRVVYVDSPPDGAFARVFVTSETFAEVEAPAHLPPPAFEVTFTVEADPQTMQRADARRLLVHAIKHDLHQPGCAECDAVAAFLEDSHA